MMVVGEFLQITAASVGCLVHAHSVAGVEGTINSTASLGVPTNSEKWFTCIINACRPIFK